MSATRFFLSSLRCRRTLAAFPNLRHVRLNSSAAPAPVSSGAAKTKSTPAKSVPAAAEAAPSDVPAKPHRMSPADSNLHGPRSKSLPSFSLENKVCVVTGAARGLGFEFCKAFVQSGCTELAVIDLSLQESQDAAKELVKFGLIFNPERSPSDYNIIGIACDVSSEISVQKAFAQVVGEFGRVDSVIASAGIVDNYSAFDYPFDRIKRLYDINVHGAFFTAREAARNMIPNGGGAIVLVASMSSNIVNIPQPQTPYNAAKAAVRHMASSLGVEWAKRGVRVNVLSPGYMLTKLTRTVVANDQNLMNTWESLTPMGRMGEPHELSGAAVLLASDASSFMTGSEIRVDGGYTVI